MLLVATVIFQFAIGYGHTVTDKDIEEAQKYFEQANDEWKKGIRDAQRVLELYNRAIELNPNLADAYIGRSVCYRLGNYGSAINRVKAKQDCEQALKLDPNSARAYRWKAYLEILDGEYKDINVLNQALADLNRAIEIDPDYLDAYDLRAMIYRQLENYPQAIADYTYILEYPDLKNSSYMKYYDFDRTSDWQWFYDWDQRIAALYYMRSLVYYNNGEIDNAIHDCEQALELSPKNDWIRSQLRKCMAEK